MGSQWVTVRDSARQGTLRAGDASARRVVERWEELLDYFALGLSKELGQEVTPGRGRNQTVQDRVEYHLHRLGEAGELAGSLRVPNAVSAIGIVANLGSRQLTTSVELRAPGEGRPLTRVRWLLRQLADGDARLRLTSSFANTRETASALLGEVREDPRRLLSASDPRREVRSVRDRAHARPLGLKNGRGAGSFIEATRAQILDFYGSVVQNLAPWQARAPRLPETPEAAEEGSSTEPDASEAVAETPGVAPPDDARQPSPWNTGQPGEAGPEAQHDEQGEPDAETVDPPRSPPISSRAF